MLVGTPTTTDNETPGVDCRRYNLNFHLESCEKHKEESILKRILCGFRYHFFIVHQFQCLQDDVLPSSYLRSSVRIKLSVSVYLIV